MSLSLASLHVYPIKSIGGYAVEEARITDRGLEHDRRWMLVDDQGRFLTQREHPTMACLHCMPIADGFRVTDARTGDSLDLPFGLESGMSAQASIWSDSVRVLVAPLSWSAWFSQRIGANARLVFMPDATRRAMDMRCAEGLTSLSDGFPFLILSQASLDDLNARMPAPLPMNRFRPNLVIAGGVPYQEDVWRGISVGAVRFSLVKPCARCAIPTTDQQTGERGKEPLRTLATYRATDGKVLFGMNAVAHGGGTVRAGDLVAP